MYNIKLKIKFILNDYNFMYSMLHNWENNIILIMCIPIV